MEPYKLEEILYKERLVLPPWWCRVGAYGVDMLLVSLLAWDFNTRWLDVLHVGFILKTHALLRYVLLYVSLHIFYEGLCMGGFGVSIGKIVFHLRVVSLKSLDNPTWIERLKRCAFKEMALLCPFIYLSKDKFQRVFHDRYAKTLVIMTK
ncbi:RDD family protein [Helicobacter salomonis]|uniref:RDD family protein n=1 Tax=Helicobacter salomonis TaxID=56878 RepID=UPI001F16D5C5|nr:RDD family protein [Helicobacter salomonis]